MLTRKTLVILSVATITLSTWLRFGARIKRCARDNAAVGDCITERTIVNMIHSINTCKNDYKNVEGFRFHLLTYSHTHSLSHSLTCHSHSLTKAHTILSLTWGGEPTGPVPPPNKREAYYGYHKY